MISIFVEFIDQLIDYPINCASLNAYAEQQGKYLSRYTRGVQ